MLLEVILHAELEDRIDAEVVEVVVRRDNRRALDERIRALRP